MNDLLLRALRCQPTPRRPLWLMRQAGRMLPEYRRLRRDFSFSQLCSRPELAAQVTLMPLQRFELDAAIVFADLMSPVTALGIEFGFDPGPVVEHPLRSAAAVAALHEPAPEEIAPEVMQTLQLAKTELTDKVPLLGFAGGPWTLAAYLVEGRSRPGFPTLRALAAAEPQLLDELLRRLARLGGDYLLEQVRAGADAVQVFETWSGTLSEPDWSRWVKPHLRTLLEIAGAAGVPRVLFMRSAAHLTQAALSLPVEAFSVDWQVDIQALHARLGGDRAVQGNLDPALLVAGPKVARAAVRELLRQVPCRGHVVNLGHGVLPETPLESVDVVLEAVHEESQVEAG